MSMQIQDNQKMQHHAGSSPYDASAQPASPPVTQRMLRLEHVAKQLAGSSGAAGGEEQRSVSHSVAAKSLVCRFARSCFLLTPLQHPSLPPTHVISSSIVFEYEAFCFAYNRLTCRSISQSTNSDHLLKPVIPYIVYTNLLICTLFRHFFKTEAFVNVKT